VLSRGFRKVWVPLQIGHFGSFYSFVCSGLSFIISRFFPNNINACIEKILSDILICSFSSSVKILLKRFMKYFCVYMQDNRLRSHVLLRLSEILQDNCYTNESVCKISGWIIAFCYDNNVRPPKFMMKKLLTALPNSTLRDIEHVLSGFEQVPKPWNRDFYKDFEIIHKISLSLSRT
jgi:hypothetical protein